MRSAAPPPSSRKCSAARGSRCSAGATCRWTWTSWARGPAPRVPRSDRSSSRRLPVDGKTTPRGSGPSISRAAPLSAALPRRDPTSSRSSCAPFHAARWCTRRCSPALSSPDSSPTSRPRTTRRRSRSSTSATRPTRRRVGRSSSRSACSRTTARSIPCGGTATRCWPASRRSPGRSGAMRWTASSP